MLSLVVELLKVKVKEKGRGVSGEKGERGEKLGSAHVRLRSQVECGHPTPH